MRRQSAGRIGVLSELHRKFSASLPDRLTEVVALTSAQLMGNAYERVQHERLSTQARLGQSWITEVLSLGESGNGELLEPELAVQRLVAAVIQRRGHSTRAELERVIMLIATRKQ